MKVISFGYKQPGDFLEDRIDILNGPLPIGSQDMLCPCGENYSLVKNPYGVGDCFDSFYGKVLIEAARSCLNEECTISMKIQVFTESGWVITDKKIPRIK